MTHNNIKIGNKIIGYGKPIFVIAEAGVNHNGDIGMAKQLVDAAKKAGADAVKFQTFRAEEFVTSKASMATYQKRNIEKKESQQDMLKKLELDYEVFGRLKKYCDRKKIIFLSTPHTETAADFLDSLMTAYKIGSGDLTNLPFLKKIARYKKPIILSTGMSTLNEIRSAVQAIKKIGNNELILLHCTTNYPCPIEEVNLKAMNTIYKKTGYLVGYSDHTKGIIVPMIAATMGAVLIEKHFTLDKTLEGPDHRASLEPQEFKEMMQAIRNVGVILGSGIKKPTAEEEKIKKVARKSIISQIDIPEGTRINKNYLTIKRPGTGIEPKFIASVIGKKAARNIKKDQIISWKHLK